MSKIAAFVISFLFISSQAYAFGVKHDFFVTVGPFDASRTEFTYRLTPDNYQVTSTVKTNGFFDTVYPFTATYNTAGRISANKLITKDYSYTSRSRFNTRTKQVFYDKEGKPLYQISGKNGNNKKREFEEPATPADTFDLQTVIVKLARQYNLLGFCDSQMAVYDGKRRFDVVFKDLGQEDLAADEHSFYQGPAAKCSMHITKLLNEDDDSLWEFSANKPIYFWIAKDKKSGYPFIARISIEETPLGRLDAYTEQITVEE